MGSRATTTVTYAPAGSGKTYARCARFLHDEFLQDETGVHYSNFPVHRELLAERLAKITKKPAEYFLDRVQLIPKEVLKEWSAERSGPWDYFRDCDLQGAHIAIDEAHNFCGEKHKPAHRKKWQDWCGELRHLGATVEFLTQDISKLAKDVAKEAGANLVLTNSELRRDPIFRILLSDWYELRAAFWTGVYTSSVWQNEMRRVMNRQMCEDSRRWPFEKYYFELYDSYNAPHSGGVKAEAPKYQFQRRTKAVLVGWFLRRNGSRLLLPLVITVVLLWGASGGFRWGLAKIMAAAKKLPATSVQQVSGAAGKGGPGPAGAGPAGQVEYLEKESPAELAKRVLAVQAELVKVSGSEAEARRELTLAKAELAERGAIALMTPDSVVLATGEAFRVGETFDNGALKGRTIKEIHFGRRAVVLDDGRTVRALGRVNVRVPGLDAFRGPGGATGGDAGVVGGGGVEGGEGAGDGYGPPFVPRKRGMSGDANGSVRGVAGQGAGGINRPGGGLGRSPYHPLSPVAERPRAARAGGSPGRSRIEPKPLDVLPRQNSAGGQSGTGPASASPQGG